VSDPLLSTRGSGQALTEFALILPVLLLTFFAVFDFGRGVFAYSTLGNAARAGARFAIVNQNESAGPCVAPANAIQCAVAVEGVTLDIDPAADVDVAYEGAGTCPGTFATSSRALGCTAVVTARTAFVPATPIISTIVGTIDMESTSKVVIERTCPEGATPCLPVPTPAP